MHAYIHTYRTHKQTWIVLFAWSPGIKIRVSLRSKPCKDAALQSRCSPGCPMRFKCGPFFSILCGPCPPHQKKKPKNPATTKDESVSGSYWNDNRKSQRTFPHATMKTTTDNVTASTYACRTIICIFPPCPAYVMEMAGVKFEQSKCLLTKQSSTGEPWDPKVLLRRGSLSRKLMSREFFFCFFSWFNLQSKKSTYFLIWNLADLPKGAQLHTPLTDSFPWGWRRQWPALLCLWLAAAEISRTFLHSPGREKNIWTDAREPDTHAWLQLHVFL